MSVIPEYIRHKNILLKEYNSLYFDVPKVASTSIKTACAKLLDIPLDKNVHFLDFPFANLQEHKQLDQYFKFGFVRNPWDRLVSCFKSKIRSADFQSTFHVNGVARAFLKYNLFYGGMSFEAFVDAVIRIPEEKADPHFASQYICFPIKENKINLDFIGRFENIKEDFSLVLEKINQSTTLTHLNKSNPSNFERYYTTLTIYKVYNRYKEDISLFNYHFK